MRITTRLFAGIAAAAIAFSAAHAIAGERGHGHHGGGDAGMRYMHHVFEQLDLSPEQKETVKGIFTSAKPRLTALHEEMRDVRESLMDTSPDAADYSTVVDAASQKSGELASQIVLEMSQIRTQVHSVLTEEQKAQLPEIRAEMKQRMEQRHERMRDKKAAQRAEQEKAAE